MMKERVLCGTHIKLIHNKQKPQIETVLLLLIRTKASLMLLTFKLEVDQRPQLKLSALSSWQSEDTDVPVSGII